MLRFVSRGLVSGLELGLAADGLYGSGLSWGLEVASDSVGLIGSVVEFIGSAVVTPAVTSSFTASVDEGTIVVRASSSGKYPDPAGETLLEGSSRPAGEEGGTVVTLSVLFSVLSCSGFGVVALGMGVGSRDDEAEMVEEPRVGPVDTGATGVYKTVVVTSGSLMGATIGSSGKMSCTPVSPIISSCGVLAAGEDSVWGAEVCVGWLETRSAAVVGSGRAAPVSAELVASLATGGGQTWF